MSADNTIYIRETPQGTYWVGHFHSVYHGDFSDGEADEFFREKLDEKRDTVEGVRSYDVYEFPEEEEEKAFEAARKMAEDIRILEYGIARWPREE